MIAGVLVDVATVQIKSGFETVCVFSYVSGCWAFAAEDQVNDLRGFTGD